MTVEDYFDKIISALLRAGQVGEVSEWFKELVLKTSDSERDRGFESHLLRLKEIMFPSANLILNLFQPYGEVPKLAEGTPLERVQVVNNGARVQIPPSPFLDYASNSRKHSVRKKV